MSLQDATLVLKGKKVGSGLPEDMTGATASAAGTRGLVPPPAAGDQDKFLKGDGTWGAISSGITDIQVATSLPSDASQHPTTLYLIGDN